MGGMALASDNDAVKGASGNVRSNDAIVLAVMTTIAEAITILMVALAMVDMGNGGTKGGGGATSGNDLDNGGGDDDRNNDHSAKVTVEVLSGGVAWVKVVMIVGAMIRVLR